MTDERLTNLAIVYWKWNCKNIRYDWVDKICIFEN